MPSRWGFQITIREQSDQTLSSGTFAVPNSTDAGASSLRRWLAIRVPGALCRQYCAAICRAPERPARRRRARRTSLMFCGRRRRRKSEGWRSMSPPLPRMATALPAGDYVYTYTQTLANAGPARLPGQPVFQSVLNGASFEPELFIRGHGLYLRIGISDLGAPADRPAWAIT